MTTKAFMLFAANEQELGDIATWLDDHPSDEEMAEAKIAPDIKPRLDALLTSLLKHAIGDSGMHVAIPTDLAPLLQMTIDDWTEVLTSHDESLHSCLTVTEA